MPDTTNKLKSFIVSSGRSYPLGATVDEQGTNFAIFSANAEKVELCLFDNSGKTELARITLPEFTDEIWHGHIADIGEGTNYGYRVHGPFTPHLGHRFNAHKLLLDPYAKKVNGKFTNAIQNYGYDVQSNQQDLTLDYHDNASVMPKAVVVSAQEKCISHPQIRRRDTIIYEMHVKGFSKQNPSIAIELQGTFAGLAQKINIDYLKTLGITSVELMPTQQFVNEAFVEHKGLSNYWGYNTIGFFLVHQQYSQSNEIVEFRAMVETLHQANIEVILDVVYNHTAEGDELGSTLSFKGIDNASYYRLKDQDKRFYQNFSGCGNTINIEHPRVVQLICDSLRYWVEELGVDGFRFDLAPVLGRENPYFNSNNAFFTTLKQDPVLAKIKLIAEPWDIGEGGYQLGRFPYNWMEWNDRFRDTTRRFWRGDNAIVPEFARRLHGSADLFEQPSRRPGASINFISSHDGFTLDDLVSFEQRHNHANNEENQDGHHANFSSNFGVEGATDNATINRLRQRQKRNLLTTLFIAQGTPMLLSGDELANSQQGNNNAYCQDNEVSWLNWQSVNDNNELAFVQQLITLRKEHPLLNRPLYQHGKNVSKKTGLADISWLNCHGQAMTEGDWHDPALKCFAMLLAETTDDYSTTTEHQGQDDALLIIFNAHHCEINYQLPDLTGHWQKLIDTTIEQVEKPSGDSFSRNNLTNEQVNVAAHSCVVLSYLQQSHTAELD